MSVTKCSYMINFGLALYFQELLQLILTDALFNVHCFDESHNSTLKKGQTDLHVLFLGQLFKHCSNSLFSIMFKGESYSLGCA